MNHPQMGEILKSAAYGLGQKAETPDQARQILQEAGILTEELIPYFAADTKQPQAAEVIMLVANMYEYLKR